MRKRGEEGEEGEVRKEGGEDEKREGESTIHLLTNPSFSSSPPPSLSSSSGDRYAGHAQGKDSEVVRAVVFRHHRHWHLRGLGLVIKSYLSMITDHCMPLYISSSSFLSPLFPLPLPLPSHPSLICMRRRMCEGLIIEATGCNACVCISTSIVTFM